MFDKQESPRMVVNLMKENGTESILFDKKADESSASAFGELLGMRLQNKHAPTTKQMQCNYDLNPTNLFQSIKNRDWKGAFHILASNSGCDEGWGSNQAAVWVISKENSGKVKWQLLPLHAAVIFKAPAEIIQLLLLEYPDGVFCEDDQGMLPLHLAFWNSAEWKILEAILTAFPQAIHVKDRKGRTPMQCASTKSKKRASALELLRVAEVEKQTETQARDDVGWDESKSRSNALSSREKSATEILEILEASGINSSFNHSSRIESMHKLPLEEEEVEKLPTFRDFSKPSFCNEPKVVVPREGIEPFGDISTMSSKQRTREERMKRFIPFFEDSTEMLNVREQETLDLSKYGKDLKSKRGQLEQQMPPKAPPASLSSSKSSNSRHPNVVDEKIRESKRIEAKKDFLATLAVDTDKPGGSFAINGEIIHIMNDVNHVDPFFRIIGVADQRVQGGKQRSEGVDLIEDLLDRKDEVKFNTEELRKGTNTSMLSPKLSIVRGQNAKKPEKCDEESIHISNTKASLLRKANTSSRAPRGLKPEKVVDVSMRPPKLNTVRVQKDKESMGTSKAKALLLHKTNASSRLPRSSKQKSVKTRKTKPNTEVGSTITQTTVSAAESTVPSTKRGYEGKLHKEPGKVIDTSMLCVSSTSSSLANPSKSSKIPTISYPLSSFANAFSETVAVAKLRHEVLGMFPVFACASTVNVTPVAVIKGSEKQQDEKTLQKINQSSMDPVIPLARKEVVPFARKEGNKDWEKELKELSAPPPVFDLHQQPTIKGIMADLDEMPVSILEALKMEIKSRLESYDSFVESRYGRAACDMDREPIRDLYDIYSILKRHLILKRMDEISKIRLQLKTLLLQKTDLKKKLKMYDEMIVASKGRPPTSKEREPIRELYEAHTKIKRDIEVQMKVAKDLEFHQLQDQQNSDCMGIMAGGWSVELNAHPSDLKQQSKKGILSFLKKKKQEKGKSPP